VAEIVALKKRQAHFKLHKFKQTRFYRLLNIFNVICFFIYLEILFCFVGPCRYEAHQASSVEAGFGQVYNADGSPIVTNIDVRTAEGDKYVFVVHDFIEVPPQNTGFYVGSDFLLRKELKGFFEDEELSYRIFAASPVLFLCSLVMVAGFLAFVYNLNQNAYSLSAISVLNGLTVFAVICY
jgi:hypothetical protein